MRILAVNLTGAGPEAPPSPARSSAGRLLLAGWYIAILILATVLALAAPRHLSKPFLNVGVFLAVLIFLAQCAYRAAGPRPVNWLSVDILFMLVYALIHFTYPVFFSLGQIAETELRVWYSTSSVCRATMLSVAGLAAFGLGFVMLADRYPCRAVPLDLGERTLGRWRLVGKVVFVSGILCMVAFLVLPGGGALKGEYTLTRQMGYGFNVLWVGFRGLLLTGTALIVVASAGLSGRFKLGWGTLLLAVFFVAFMTVFGARGTLAVIILVMAAAYGEGVKSVSLKKLVIAVLAGLFLFSTIRVARAMPERSIGGFIRAAIGQSGDVSILSAVSELGASARTVYASVGIVPRPYPYFFGRLWYTGVVGVVPFANRFLPELGGAEYAGTGSFVTYVIRGRLGPDVAGAGASIVADYYLNFGVPGVLLGMIALGLLAKYVQQRARSGRSIVWGVAHVVMIPGICLVARNSVPMLIRGVLWPALFVVVVGWLMGLPRSSRSAHVDYSRSAPAGELHTALKPINYGRQGERE